MWKGLYNSGNSIPLFLLHRVSLRSSGHHLLAGRSILLKTRGLVGQMQHRTAPSAPGFPVSQMQADVDRRCQCYRQARSVTLGGLPCSSTTQGLLQPSHRSRAALREIRIRPVIYQTVEGVGFQSLFLYFLTFYCCFPPNCFMVLLFYKKIHLICFFF